MKEFGKYAIVFILATIAIILAVSLPQSGDPNWFILTITSKVIAAITGCLTYKTMVYWTLFDPNETV